MHAWTTLGSRCIQNKRFIAIIIIKIQYIFPCLPAVVPARVENLKIYNHDFKGLVKDNSSDSEVNCSVVKITWDPPSNYNETAIDHYEVAVLVGPGIQHIIINVINTEWTFTPSDSELASLAVATNLSLEDIQFNVSVSAVDICGQNGTSNAIQITKFCHRDPTSSDLELIPIILVSFITIFTIILILILFLVYIIILIYGKLKGYMINHYALL